MIEIIATTLEDAIRIEKSGADRIELISALTEGGLTPSYSLIKNVVQSVKIPVNVMIRPNGKSFVYTDDEIKIMLEDILIAKELKANGVVFGVLNWQNEICITSLERLLKVCDDIDVTFHRAIDETSDQIKAIQLLTKYDHIKNVLTAGGKGNIIENIKVIKDIVERSKHIDILVGGGLNISNIIEIMGETKAPQYHFGTAARYNKSAFEEIDIDSLSELVNIVNK